MGYALLWIENLASALLLAAILLALVGKIRRRWLSRPLGVMTVLAPLAGYAVTILWAGSLIDRVPPDGVLYPLVLSAICYTIGGAWMLLRGLRGRGDSSVSINAGQWPSGRLAAAFAVILALHAMTFWSLDASVRQQLTSIRAEAGALALSITPPPVADRENAALAYQPAFEVMDTDDWPGIWQEAVEAINPGQSPPAEEVEFDFASHELGEFLNEHAGEMAVIRKAAALPDCRFERDYGRPSFDMLIPEQAHLRDAARLMDIDARHKVAKGDPRGALENINAMFAMSRHAASEPHLVPALFSMAINNMGVRTLETVLTSAPLDAEDLQTLDLQESVSYRRLVARGLRMEEAMGLLFFCAWGGEVKSMGFEETDLDDLFETPGTAALYRVFHLAEDLASYREHLRTYHVGAAEPYYATQGKWSDFKKALEIEGAGVLTSLMLPNLTGVVEAVQRTEAWHRAAMLGVATYRYQAKHGRLPAALGDLSPEFVNIIPRDPFDGEPMRFRLTDEGCVIYALGKDLVDNGGGPIEWGEKTGDLRFIVTLPSDTSDEDSKD